MSTSQKLHLLCQHFAHCFYPTIMLKILLAKSTGPYSQYSSIQHLPISVLLICLLCMLCYSVQIFNSLCYIIGGAIYLDSSYISFQGRSTIRFNNNTATLSGGAIATLRHSSVTFTGHSAVVFYSNVASQDGAGVYSAFSSNCSFSENSCVTFHSNIAQQKGAAL